MAKHLFSLPSKIKLKKACLAYSSRLELDVRLFRLPLPAPLFRRRLPLCAYPRLIARPPLCRKLPSAFPPTAPTALLLLTPPDNPAPLLLSPRDADADVPDVEPEAGPNPPTAHPTSIPHLMLHSHARTNTGVLMSTFSTGYMSGYRAGGAKIISSKWSPIAAAYVACNNSQILVNAHLGR